MDVLNDKSLTIISPVYKNEGTLIELIDRVFQVAEKLYTSYEYLFVVDGSPDDSFNILLRAAEKDSKIKVINLSRNFGQHTAIMAGIDNAKGDHIFIIDADLEELPECLIDFKKEIDKNHEIVVGIRKDYSRSFFKTVTARAYTFLYNMLSDYKIIGNTTNMRLLTKTYASHLRQFKEYPFIGGFCSWIGIPISLIEIEMGESDNNSAYTLSKLLSHARTGIIGFSNRLIRLSLIFGLIVSLSAFGFGVYRIIYRLLNPGMVAGYTTVIVALVFLLGIILVILGIMGEYIIDINNQTKGRPRYFVDKKINF